MPGWKPMVLKTIFPSGWPCDLAFEEPPMPFGDNFDDTVHDLDGCLVVDRIPRHRHMRGPLFGVGHGVLRTHGVVQMREDRETNQAQRAVATSGRLPAHE